MNRNPRVEELLACAVRAARAAGRHALRHASRRGEVIARAQHDVKLQLDRECQAMASAVIAAAYPDHAVLGEEDPAATLSPAAGGARSRFLWIVDPIDGTVNYLHGLRSWCSSVAVQRAGRTVAGCVYAPAMGELYAAGRGLGATLNGRPIRVSGVRRLADALVLTGLDRTSDTGMREHALFTRLAAACQRARIVGSAALDLCQVGCGRADGYFESGIYIWDIAAAGLIAEEAGGKVDLLKRLKAGRIQFAGSNGRLQRQLRAALDGAD